MLTFHKNPAPDAGANTIAIFEDGEPASAETVDKFLQRAELLEVGKALVMATAKKLYERFDLGNLFRQELS